MKTPSEYLIEQLEIFTSKFCFISVCYAYDNESDFHVIEITHDGSLKKNLDFAKWKTGVWHEFYKMYPSEDLLITKQGRLTNKSNVLYEMASHSEVGRELFSR